MQTTNRLQFIETSIIEKVSVTKNRDRPFTTIQTNLIFVSNYNGIFFVYMLVILVLLMLEPFMVTIFPG